MLRQLLAPALFLVSSGIYFVERGRKNIAIVFVAGLLAICGTFFTVKQIVELVVAYFGGTTTSSSEIIAAIILTIGSIVATLIGAVVGETLRRNSVAKEREIEAPIARAVDDSFSSNPTYASSLSFRHEIEAIAGILGGVSLIWFGLLTTYHLITALSGDILKDAGFYVLLLGVPFPMMLCGAQLGFWSSMILISKNRYWEPKGSN